LPKGKPDPAFHTNPDLAWTLIEEARAAEIPFRLVVADSVYGENALLEGRLFAAHIPDVMGLRPAHGTWQWVPDPRHPPAFTPAEAAQRLPKRAWQRTVRLDRHGKELVRYIGEWELGNVYGPTCSVRLIVATLDPAKLDPKSTWYLATSLPLSEASAEEVYEIYRLRDWIEHDYKPAKHELGWADYQMRTERAILRHWHLVMLAFTFSLLLGSPPTCQALPTPAAPLTPAEAGGEKRRAGRRGAHYLGRDVAQGAPMVMSVGAVAALLAALVECCSAA
jgi:SRSO17 transposase